ncbi:hypothetical protein WA026_016742 [Henosepilachna vigintioctopunctata]|uniref:Uncharacterized protein n=1 Tax=Henosepilachna vigintioctopunctata TaxID=420089 RepID=A0AAW1UTH7_9CUCU
MLKLMWNRLLPPEIFTPRYYWKHYDVAIPVLLVIADTAWVITASIHALRNYDIIIRNSARDRHEEYDQFLKFHHHQWWIAPGITEAHAKPRKELYDLYTEMENRWPVLEQKKENCEKKD